MICPPQDAAHMSGFFVPRQRKQVLDGHYRMENIFTTIKSKGAPHETIYQSVQ
jgi:hypothetical protein